MAWAKLTNLKRSSGSIGIDEVRVIGRAGPHNTRMVVIKLGSRVCERASFGQKDHKVHVMVGDGDDAGKLAVALDDSFGTFKAKRLSSGEYTIYVTEAAAGSRFSTTFPPFNRVATHIAASAGPKVIVVPVTPEFLAA